MAEPDLTMTATTAHPATGRANASGFSPQEQAIINGQLALPVTTPNVQGTEPVAAAPAGTTVETLLTPTQDTPGDPYVHFGNVQVERGLVDNFKAAETYLSKDPEAVNVLNALVNGKQTITIHEISNGQDQFDPGNQQIDWDPKTALLNANGSKVTPALALLHEQGHASEFERDPARQQTNANDGNQRFDNAEEQRNITGLEARAAKILGEGTRGDHGGTAYRVQGPTSVQSDGIVMTDAAKLKSAIHDERFGLAAHGYAVPPAPGKAADSIGSWDKTAHTGSIVHIDGDTVAQYVGGGKYQVYDVNKDLHGVMPPENNPGVTIDAKGNVQAPPGQQQTLAPAPAQPHEPAAIGGR